MGSFRKLLLTLYSKRIRYIKLFPSKHWGALLNCGQWNTLLRMVVESLCLEMFRSCLVVILGNLLWVALLEGIHQWSPEAPFDLCHSLFVWSFSMIKENKCFKIPLCFKTLKQTLRFGKRHEENPHVLIFQISAYRLDVVLKHKGIFQLFWFLICLIWIFELVQSIRYTTHLFQPSCMQFVCFPMFLHIPIIVQRFSPSKVAG